MKYGIQGIVCSSKIVILFLDCDADRQNAGYLFAFHTRQYMLKLGGRFCGTFRGSLVSFRDIIAMFSPPISFRID